MMKEKYFCNAGILIENLVSQIKRDYSFSVSGKSFMETNLENDDGKNIDISQFCPFTSLKIAKILKESGIDSKIVVLYKDGKFCIIVESSGYQVKGLKIRRGNFRGKRVFEAEYNGEDSIENVFENNKIAYFSMKIAEKIMGILFNFDFYKTHLEGLANSYNKAIKGQ